MTIPGIEPRSPLKRELEALRVTVTAIEELDSEAQQRVLRYLLDRFEQKTGLFGLPIKKSNSRSIEEEPS